MQQSRGHHTYSTVRPVRERRTRRREPRRRASPTPSAASRARARRPLLSPESCRLRGGDRAGDLSRRRLSRAGDVLREGRRLRSSGCSCRAPCGGGRARAGCHGPWKGAPSCESSSEEYSLDEGGGRGGREDEGRLHICSSRVRACRSGCSWRSCSASLADILGRDLRVRTQTDSKLVRLQKFCVTATAVSRLSTTCHQPPGTNMVSPGRWIAVRGRWLGSAASSRVG